MKRNIGDAESRAFWEFVDKAASQVNQWPAWMRGEQSDLGKAFVPCETCHGCGWRKSTKVRERDGIQQALEASVADNNTMRAERDEAVAALNKEMNLCIEALDKTTIQRDIAESYLMVAGNALMGLEHESGECSAEHLDPVSCMRCMGIQIVKNAGRLDR